MDERIEIYFNGRFESDVTTSVTSIVAEHGLNILDINQYVNYGNLLLVIIVAFPLDTGDCSETIMSLKASFLSRFHNSDCKFSIEPLSFCEDENKVLPYGEHRFYALTLLASRVTSKHIDKVSKTLTLHGLNITRISPLSYSRQDRSPAYHNQLVSCLEFLVSDEDLTLDLDKLKTDILHLSDELNIDLIFQEDTIYRRNRRLVIFDMDSTLIEEEVIDLLAQAAGIGDYVSAITEQAMQGELDFNESFSKRLALLKGLDESVLAGIAEKLTLTRGAETLVKSLRVLGYRTAIISGGFTYFAHYLQKKLGINYVFANELEIVDGKLTGNPGDIIINGQRKAELLRQLAVKEGIYSHQVVAVGDGANDIPMLNVAGLGIAFRAKPMVKQNTRHSISTMGLDSILYVLGYTDKELRTLHFFDGSDNLQVS